MTISEMHTAFKLELDKIDSLQYPSFTSNEIDYWLNQAIRRFVKTRYSGTNYKREGFEQTQKRIDDLRTIVREVTVTCTATEAIKSIGEATIDSYVLTNGFSNSIFTAAPYWLSLGEEVLLTIGLATTIRQGVTEVTADEYRSEIDNPYSSFRLHYGNAKPLRLFYNDTIEFISDGNYVVTSAYVRYIKQPVPVNYTATTGVLSGNILPGRRYLAVTNTITYNGVAYAATTTFLGVEGVTTFTAAAGGTVNFVATDCELPEQTHDEIVALGVQMALENIEQPRYQSYSQDVATME
jgi:hypothetical protein